MYQLFQHFKESALISVLNLYSARYDVCGQEFLTFENVIYTLTQNIGEGDPYFNAKTEKKYDEGYSDNIRRRR
jgi:hypothetical protein